MIILPWPFPTGFFFFNLSLILLVHQKSRTVCLFSLISELIFRKHFDTQSKSDGQNIIIWVSPPIKKKNIYIHIYNIIFYHLFCLDPSETAAKPFVLSTLFDHSQCSVLIRIGSSEAIFSFVMITQL